METKPQQRRFHKNGIARMLIAIALSLLSFNAIAQSVTYAINGDTTVNASISTLIPDKLKEATYIKITGEWTGNIYDDTNIARLQHAINGTYDIPASLVTFDASEATANINGVSLNAMFSNCPNLNMVDISGFTHITEMYNAFNGCSSLTSVIFPETNNNTDDGVYVNFGNAFKGCSQLKACDLSAFTKIGDMGGVFCGCSSLTNVTLPKINLKEDGTVDFNSAFINCSELNVIDLSGFTRIGNMGNAFNDCSSLTSVILPAINYSPDWGVDFSSTFTNCSKLSTIDLSGFTKITKMGSTFSGCSSLISITLPSLDLDMGFGSSFYNCSKLNTIDLSGFTQITDMNNTFSGCSSLTNVILPTTNKYTGAVDFSSTFYNCSELSTIDLRGFSKINSMNNTFSGCSSLTNVTLPTTNNYTDDGVDFSSAFNNCSKLNAVDLSGFSKINMNSAFNGCSSLTSVVFSETKSSGVTDFGSAFRMCSKLRTINLSAFSISGMYSAFNGCSSLTSVTLPKINSYTSWEIRFDSTFTNCSKLQTCDLSGFSVISTMYNVFNGCSSLVEVTMPTTNNFLGFWGPGVDFSGAFYNCSKLKSCDLSGFTDVWTLNDAFYSCSALESFKINTLPRDKFDPTSGYNLSSFDFFTDCNSNCLKYVPSEFASRLQNWTGNIIDISDSIAQTDIIITQGKNFGCPTTFTVPSGKTISYTYKPTSYATRGTASGWQTIIMPFDVTNISASGFPNMKPAISGASGNLWLRTFTSSTASSVSFSDNMDQNTPYIKAGVPYIIAFPGDSYGTESLSADSITFSNSEATDRTIASTTDSVTVSYAGGAYKFIASYDSTDVSHSYTLNQEGTAFVLNNGNFSPMQAYFRASESTPLGAKILKFSTGETTGIFNLTGNDNTSSLYKYISVMPSSEAGSIIVNAPQEFQLPIYSINGTCVRVVNVSKGSNTISGLASGIYIVGGKTIVVK